MNTSSTRKQVVAKLVFSGDAAGPSDLLDLKKTSTELIALLQELQAKGWIFGVTCVYTGHHPDGQVHGHHPMNGGPGDCIDGWPMNSHKPGDWIANNDPKLVQFIKDAAASKYCRQLGATPDVYSILAPHFNGKGWGSPDDGGSHLHLGAV